MFARLTIYENVDLDLADRIKQFMDTLQPDPFGEQPGYRGSMTLVDRDNSRLVGIGFYASAGQAHEADALLTTLPDTLAEQVPDAIRPALDMRPESVGLYEIVHRDEARTCAPGAFSRRPTRAVAPADHARHAAGRGDRGRGDAHAQPAAPVPANRERSSTQHRSRA